MVKLKGSSPDDFELIPEHDIVSARLQDVTMRTFTWDGEEVEKLKWTVVITDPGPWQGKELFGDTSTNFTVHPNCKAYNWAKALTGKSYDNGEELDTDDLLGLPCRVMIGHKKDKGGTTWMRVREVLPSRGAASQAPVENPF